MTTPKGSYHLIAQPKRLSPNALEALFVNLKQEGYQIVGPTLKDGAIVYQNIDSAQQLPRGWQEHQRPGSYKLESLIKTRGAVTQRPHTRGPFFAHRLGPEGARPWFLPPKQQLWSAKKKVSTETAKSVQTPPSQYEIFYPPERAAKLTKKTAFIGLRACDLKAISIQDRIFLEDHYAQPNYAANRKDNLIIAVNCTSHASTCFCTSMDCGPAVTSGYDLALTEVWAAHAKDNKNNESTERNDLNENKTDDHYLVAQAGSELGETLLEKLHAPTASAEEIHRAQTAIRENADSMPHRDLTGVPAAMKHNPEHPQWETIAQQCLACGNCTLVCPTCFCTTVEDTTNLTGDTAERWLTWDSCFNEDHSYIHGGKVHGSIASRYRQWATHKLSSWHEQFDESGCVGCGRCIAWCPVGIDLRDVASAFVETDASTTNDTTLKQYDPSDSTNHPDKTAGNYENK